MTAPPAAGSTWNGTAASRARSVNTQSFSSLRERLTRTLTGQKALWRGVPRTTILTSSMAIVSPGMVKRRRL